MPVPSFAQIVGDSVENPLVAGRKLRSVAVRGRERMLQAAFEQLWGFLISRNSRVT
jgi:hypothetical protein